MLLFETYDFIPPLARLLTSCDIMNLSPKTGMVAESLWVIGNLVIGGFRNEL